MAVNPRLRRFLGRHRTLAADTMVFIYHWEEHPRYAPATSAILEALEGRGRRGVTSILTLSEVLVKPLRDGDRAAVAEYRRLLAAFPNLRLLDVTQSVAETAARLRADHGLALPDAVQIATALAAGATGFVSNDPTFKRVKEIEVLLLDEVAAPRR